MAAGAVDLGAITAVTLTWDGVEVPEALPHPLAPRVASLAPLAGGAMVGTLMNADETFSIHSARD